MEGFAPTAAQRETRPTTSLFWWPAPTTSSTLSTSSSTMTSGAWRTTSPAPKSTSLSRRCSSWPTSSNRVREMFSFARLYRLCTSLCTTSWLRWSFKVWRLLTMVSEARLDLPRHRSDNRTNSSLEANTILPWAISSSCFWLRFTKWDYSKWTTMRKTWTRNRSAWKQCAPETPMWRTTFGNWNNPSKQ